MSRRRLIAGVIAIVFLLVVVLAAIAPFLGGDGTSNGQPQRTSTSDALPAVNVSNLEGDVVNFESLVGQPLVLNYWYAACPPCEKELPAFAEVAADLGDSVRFVGVNPLDDAETARSFAASKGVTYEQLLDHTSRSVDALGLTKYPSTVFISPSGSVLEVVGHDLTADELRSLITKHFDA